MGRSFDVNGRKAIAIVTVFVLMVPALTALAQRTAKPRATRAVAAGAAAGPAIATVGGTAIPRAELESRLQQALQQYRERSGARDLPSEMMDLLRRQVLENLLRVQLLQYEADREGLRATPEEAEASLKQAPQFNPGGHFDAARFEAARTQQKATFDAIAGIARELGMRRLYSSLEARFLPSEAEARASASRVLTRALIDHFTLRASDFGGAYPEPRERQVADWYAAHRADYQRPDRATLTVAFVNSPGLPDSLRRVPALRDAWTRRMHAVADSLVLEMSRGATFDSVTRELGPRASIVVTSDNFPGYWRGTAAQGAKLFQPRMAGRALEEAVAADDGWLLVRVDEVRPAHLAPMREVAREIRAALRRDSRLHHEEYEERALYAQLRGSLVAPASAAARRPRGGGVLGDSRPAPRTTSPASPTPASQLLALDAASGAIVVKPLADVRDDLASRWVLEQRAQRGRIVLDAILSAWSVGKRDPGAEAQAVLRETPPLVPGSAIDTGLVAMTLTDSLWKLGTPHGTGVVPWRRGWIAWEALDRVDRVAPTFEQARPLLAYRVQLRREADELDGARAYFSSDSMRFNLGNVIHFERVSVTAPPVLSVPLTRAEVEKWRHDHMDKYSAPELVTARHVLIRPVDASPAADSAARAEALSILARAQAGEDFAALARQYSEDPATRDAGGDLGAFGRGTMLDAFEKAAFALSPGDLCDHPVRTEVGDHIIKCVDHVPAFVVPLPLVYSQVAGDAAQEKANRIARDRCDSLVATCHTLTQLQAGLRRLDYTPTQFHYQPGAGAQNPLLVRFFDELTHLKPGEGHTTPTFMKGDGYWIAWVDSVWPPSPPTSGEEARMRVLAEYQRGAGRRAMEAKRAELDSLAAEGWSYDSLARALGADRNGRST